MASVVLVCFYLGQPSESPLLGPHVACGSLCTPVRAPAYLQWALFEETLSVFSLICFSNGPS